MKFFIICISMLIVCAAVTNAQDIEATLSGDTATQGFTVKSNAGTPLFTVRGDGKIGINILNPTATLHVAGVVKITGGSPGAGKVLTSDADGLARWTVPTGGTLDNAYDVGGPGTGRIITADAGAVTVAGVDGFLVTAGGSSQGTIPASGAGARMMWYPKKRAFRAGHVNGTEWDDAYIGDFSAAVGHSTTASGQYSTAMGYSTIASGNFSTVMGGNTIASGMYATAMGSNNTASGQYSTAMGYNSTASGNHSIAMGLETTASGISSTALGSYASTGGYPGSMVIGDNSTTNVIMNTAENQLKVRFAGGIRLYTNAATTTGTYLNASASGWTNFSDRNRKENFAAIDGEELLARLRSVPVSEWNYKGTESSVRYIGPMAQDFWQAFHLGGTDSLGINSVSIDGVNMAAIQALEKRTTELNKKTAELQQKNDEIASLKQRVAMLEFAQALSAAQATEVQQLRIDVAALKDLITQKSPDATMKHASLDSGK